MNSNDDKIREILESEEVPEKLSPENVKIMLDEQAPARKRKKISAAGKIAAGLAACAVIAGGAVYTFRPATNEILSDSADKSKSQDIQVGENSDIPDITESEESYTETAEAPYMAGAESYEQIYKMIKKSYEKYERQSLDGGDIRFYTNSDKSAGAVMSAAEEAETADTDADGIYPDSGDNSMEYYEDSAAVEVPENSDDFIFEDDEAEVYNESEENPEYSETYNQEENVLEADIVKTDGKYIYYVRSDYDYDNAEERHVLNIAGVDSGKFTGTETLDLTPDLSRYSEDEYYHNISVNDMYLYNDMIIAVGSVYSGYDGYFYYVDGTGAAVDDFYYGDSDECFVSFYTRGESPELIGTYWQDGNYSDVRISPDGYMYLVSSYISADFMSIQKAENINRYIPSCGVDEDLSCLPPEDILLPEEEPEDSDWLEYTVIGSIDLNTPGEFSPVDSKALAGYTGELYSSANNIYTAAGWNDTDITRISIDNGFITPAASGTVGGYVKDQFSMSEYNGYFRVATTANSTYMTADGRFRTNCVYVLDMDMNTVGKISDFGDNESIKSVNFSGDTAYVVTYQQTDPLFAIDLSNPSEPVIMDDFKILGYSTYMQKWSDGLLLGFGVNADERGIETGVKITMFDSSDPYNLQEAGTYTIDRDNDDMWVYSDAVWERKALLIAPEKNLIGFPLYVYRYGEYDEYYTLENTSEYMFFSYSDGEFEPIGKLVSDTSDDGYMSESLHLNRAVYIGDYVYVLSPQRFISADIETLTETDNAYF